MDDNLKFHSFAAFCLADNTEFILLFSSCILATAAKGNNEAVGAIVVNIPPPC